MPMRFASVRKTAPRSPLPVTLSQTPLERGGGRGLARLVGERTRTLVGLHLSQNNNTPALAERAFRRGLERLGAKVALEVAGPAAPTGWFRA